MHNFMRFQLPIYLSFASFFIFKTIFLLPDTENRRENETNYVVTRIRVKVISGLTNATTQRHWCCVFYLSMGLNTPDVCQLVELT